MQGSAITLYDSEGNVTGAIEAMRNITKCMVAQIELNKSEAGNRSLLDTIPDMTFLIAEDGTLLDYNAPETSLLHMPRQSLLAREYGISCRIVWRSKLFTVHIRPKNRKDADL